MMSEDEETLVSQLSNTGSGAWAMLQSKLISTLTCEYADPTDGGKVLCYILSHDKNEQLEARLNETRRQMELEQARNKELDLRQEEMAKIRHDFNNQLAAIVQLVCMGEDKAAQEVLDALADEIDQF